MKINLATTPTTIEEWRDWLENHHHLEKEVWVVFYKAASNKPTITYDDALDEALCYGWIDSIIQRIDEERYARKFTPRTNTQKWSISNQRRVARLIREGRMKAAGLDKIPANADFREDQEDDRPKELIIPLIVEQGFRANALAWQNFLKLPPSHKKRYIGWITSAKKEETVRKRIQEAVGMLERGEYLGLK